MKIAFLLLLIYYTAPRRNLLLTMRGTDETFCDSRFISHTHISHPLQWRYGLYSWETGTIFGYYLYAHFLSNLTSTIIDNHKG